MELLPTNSLFQRLLSLLFVHILFLFPYSSLAAFDINSGNNVVLYWGQNSAGYIGGQQSLGTYCASTDVDIISIAFVNTFDDSAHRIPLLNLAWACSTFPGSSQLYCPDIGADITYCQSLGKKILLSIGGAVGNYSFTSNADARIAAYSVWSTFMGGGRSSFWQRPFGKAEVDGIDLDLEQPAGVPGVYWPAFIKKIRQLYLRGGRHGTKTYYVTAAPQCPEPDVILSPAMLNKAAWFDMLFIQFYNNYCEPTGSYFNFDSWSNWAQTESQNLNVKLFIGIPADDEAATAGGWLPLAELQTLITTTQTQFLSAGTFGGVMIWDASRTTPILLDGIKGALTGSCYLSSKRDIDALDDVVAQEKNTILQNILEDRSQKSLGDVRAQEKSTIIQDQVEEKPESPFEHVQTQNSSAIVPESVEQDNNRQSVVKAVYRRISHRNHLRRHAHGSV